MRVKLIHQFLKQESFSSIILFIMAVIAVIWANSPLAFVYQRFTDAFLFWINEGLMAVFFLIVGLELKREFLIGQLTRISQVALPGFAAIGGMLIPALVYWSINHTNPVTIKGWATPIATDIAFALGALSLFARRVPISIKLFLLALAIFDDLGAIVVIAFFYSRGLSYIWLFQSAVLLFILYLFNVLAIRSLIPYLLGGIFLWICLLRSGLHPTIAGILLACIIPVDDHQYNSPLHTLEHLLHPWVAYFIMPLFALANAGISLHGLSFDILVDVVVLGIVLGLFIGKQVGVFGFAWLTIKCGLAKLPEKSTWLELYGVALLCGIGFTMSLFLGTLSFENESTYLTEVRFGVIIGSLLSSLAGAVVLLIAYARKKEQHR